MSAGRGSTPQDLAALTGDLAPVGALETVRAMVDRPHAHELLRAADLIAYAYTAGGQLRCAIDSLVIVHRVPKRSAKAGRPRKTCGLPASLS
ncbi:hypothetical protein [Rhodococcus sp. DMU1]|uniref:hypothetical protein n=1 Tax=Rhodococcus sp. DMU1 TaxID=2722825 RepID=UPI00143E7AF6|nr:hypothetical protein [Rhodococcus sp. DMU1]QIX53532.1 hypothetical protein HFP48_30590 [Rhodococcus sp. DMU1]